MPKHSEDSLAQAERYVLETEAHVARQREIARELAFGNDLKAAERERKLLRTMEDTLKVLRDYLRLERELRGLGP